MSNLPPNKPAAGRMVEPPPLDQQTRVNLRTLELGARLIKQGYDAAKSEGPPMSMIRRRKERLDAFMKKAEDAMAEVDGRLDKLEPRFDDGMNKVHTVLDAHEAQLKDMEDFVHSLEDVGGHNGSPPLDGAK